MCKLCPIGEISCRIIVIQCGSYFPYVGILCKILSANVEDKGRRANPLQNLSSNVTATVHKGGSIANFLIANVSETAANKTHFQNQIRPMCQIWPIGGIPCNIFVRKYSSYIPQGDSIEKLLTSNVTTIVPRGIYLFFTLY